MALNYHDGAWTLDGEPISPEDLAAYRDVLADQYADELGQIAIDELGDEEPSGRGLTDAAAAAFVLLFMRRVTDMITISYTAPRGGVTGTTDAQWRAVVDIVVRQQRYANGFGVALRDGTVSKAQAVARARMYAGASIEAFSLGMAHRVGFDAPAHPTQGCRGGGNCRCWWSIVEFPDRIEATWKAVGDAETCEVCRQRARDWNPFIQRKREGA